MSDDMPLAGIRKAGDECRLLNKAQPNKVIDELILDNKIDLRPDEAASRWGLLLPPRHP